MVRYQMALARAQGRLRHKYEAAATTRSRSCGHEGLRRWRTTKVKASCRRRWSATKWLWRAEGRLRHKYEAAATTRSRSCGHEEPGGGAPPKLKPVAGADGPLPNGFGAPRVDCGTNMKPLLPVVVAVGTGALGGGAPPKVKASCRRRWSATKWLWRAEGRLRHKYEAAATTRSRSCGHEGLRRWRTRRWRTKGLNLPTSRNGRTGC